MPFWWVRFSKSKGRYPKGVFGAQTGPPDWSNPSPPPNCFFWGFRYNRGFRGKIPKKRPHDSLLKKEENFGPPRGKAFQTSKKKGFPLNLAGIKRGFKKRGCSQRGWGFKNGLVPFGLKAPTSWRKPHTWLGAGFYAQKNSALSHWEPGGKNIKHKILNISPNRLIFPKEMVRTHGFWILGKFTITPGPQGFLEPAGVFKKFNAGVFPPELNQISPT